ncbi:hypothetical protein DMN91_001052 [Ooceraea biroi]|uniref:Uncharacterized protein n=1 Tax=Ooceraea biroi TaxID=2015173 RepID=A0A3L8E3I0_OOCBI|nr:hypothetical protein DMN91_001052 [Ooceraea biroi]
MPQNFRIYWTVLSGNMFSALLATIRKPELMVSSKRAHFPRLQGLWPSWSLGEQSQIEHVILKNPPSLNPAVQGSSLTKVNVANAQNVPTGKLHLRLRPLLSLPTAMIDLVLRKMSSTTPQTTWWNTT